MKINGLQPIQPKPVNETDARNPQVLAAARMYENQFLREMVKAMRASVPQSEFSTPSMGEKIFREQLDDEYVDRWVENGGTGMADMIYQQIMEKYFSRAEAKPLGPIALQKPTTPIAIDTKSDNASQFRLSLPTGETGALVAPLAGEIRSSETLGEGLKSVLLDHGQGLKTRISYFGEALDLRVGSHVSAGQKLGFLNVDRPTAYLSVNVASPDQQNSFDVE